MQMEVDYSDPDAVEAPYVCSGCSAMVQIPEVMGRVTAMLSSEGRRMPTWARPHIVRKFTACIESKQWGEEGSIQRQRVKAAMKNFLFKQYVITIQVEGHRCYMQALEEIEGPRVKRVRV